MPSPAVPMPEGCEGVLGYQVSAEGTPVCYQHNNGRRRVSERGTKIRGIKITQGLKRILARRNETNQLRGVSSMPTEDSRSSSKRLERAGRC